MSDATESLSSLVEAFRRWMALRSVVARTIKFYLQQLKRFFRFLESRNVIVAGRVDVPAIEGELLSDYQAFLFERVSRKTGKKLTSNTQLGMLLSVAMFCKFLAVTHRLAHDPSTIIRRPRQVRGLPAALLSSEEARRVLAQPKTDTVLGFRDRAILEVFWCTGMRASELLSLAVADVNFTEGLVTIRHGKGDRERVVPLGSAAVEWLREYVGRVRPLLERRPLKTSSSDPRRRAVNPTRLFLSCRGLPLDISGMLHRLKIYQRRAGLKKHLVCHTFRHSLATEMLKRGADLRHIQAMLGHECLVTTQRYTHIVKGELKKVHGKTHPRETAPFAGVTYRGSRA